MNYLDLSKINNVIFDFDGLLVNSEDVINACWIKTCDYFEIDYPEGFFDNIVGVSKDVTYKALKEYMLQPIDEKDFFHQRALFIDEEVKKGEVKLLPGVQQFLEKLDERNISMYIATSSSRSWPINLINRLNIQHFFGNIYGYEDVDSVKPSPDLYLKVIAENQLDTDTTVIFEDSLSGITAATSAGVHTIVVNPKKYTFSKLMEKNILFQINSFSELKTDHP